ncbi:hypothetical protein [Sphaerisporangium rhizosphaerae]|uniref:Uncharacterized protein n=1 Tax=Sphaerisporangium rhizosphaerae TaxID=2269375 RepID=A0ABW2P4U5_9ACTN
MTVHPHAVGAPSGASPLDRDALVEAMRPVAEALTRHVHDHQPAAVERLLTPLGVIELRALAVVLASLRRPQRTLPEDGIVDEIAVELAARGERVMLTKAERQAAAAQIVAWGHGPSEVAARLNVSGQTARTLYEHARRLRHRTDLTTSAPADDAAPVGRRAVA